MRLRTNLRSSVCVLASILLISVVLNNQPPLKGQSQTTCVKSSSNPVLTPGPQGSWDYNQVGRESVLYNGSQYNMWYSSSDTQLSIGYASSKDGIHWVKQPAPVLTRGSNGTWDAGGVEGPSVLWNGTLFLMYFTGSSGTLASDIGVAFSKDMIHWTKYEGNPIVSRTPNSYDRLSVKFANVVFDSGAYKMWYDSRPSIGDLGEISYATSGDGLHWSKYPGNPVVTATTSGRAIYAAARYPSVVRIGESLVMFLLFTNQTDDISFAVSADGVNWVSDDQILLTNSNSTTDWDYVPYYPSVIREGSLILMWYSGQPESQLTPAPSIGLAYCSLLTLSSTVSKTIEVTLTSSTTTRLTVPQNITIVKTVDRGSLGDTVSIGALVLAFASGILVTYVIARTRGTKSNSQFRDG